MVLHTPLEDTLATIWAEVLGLEKVEIDDNFFDLGGESLLTIQLVERIEEAFEIRLPLIAIAQAPTIEQLAGLIQQSDQTESWASLVALQPGGSRLPLYLVHAIAGHVLYYRDLATLLGEDQPVYGLQQPGWNQGHPLHTRVEDMAAYYIRALQTLQPKGPYLLGGLSFGGLIAFEMAQQLHEQGEHVALLALLDTHSPTERLANRALGYKTYALAQRLDFHFGNLWAINPKQRWVYLLERASLFRSRVWGRVREIEQINFHAMQSYKPKPYPGPITFFRANRHRFELADPQASWGKFAAGGLEMHEIPGYHGSLVAPPHVSVLATKLRVCLEEAQGVPLTSPS